MQILIAGPAHAASLAELAATTFPLACPAGEPQADIDAHVATELSPARFARSLVDPTQTVLVAADEDGLAGYVVLVRAAPRAEVAALLRRGPTTELNKCYVRAEHHGAGVGAALVSRALALCTTAGTWLGVSPLNDRAGAFYRRQGFVVVGEHDFTLGTQTYRDTVMERFRG